VTDLKTASSDLVMQTLAWARRHEFRPVPLHPRSKAAISRAYVEKNYTPPPDDYWRRNDFGVGIVTGPSHHGPIDIDMDCDEAVYFSERFLPHTPAIFGRASKPRSHYLYKVNAATMDKVAFIDPVLKSTIVEVRADGGHQTVFPGSLHQDTGELISWDATPFPDVPAVDADPLLEQVKLVAIATLIARHIWMEGQRNEMVKHLSGMFYYLNWPEDKTALLIEAVMDYCHDDDKTRRLTLANTYKKAEQNGKVTGATTLRKLVDEGLVDRILDLAGSKSVNILQEYNERFAVVNVEGRFRVVLTDVEPSRAPVFFLKDDFMNMMAPDLSDIVGATGNFIPKTKIWLASARRRTYWDVDFLPGEEDTNGVLNLWTGWPVQPSHQGSCSEWLRLLHDNICGGDPELGRWLLHWFCQIIREPREKSLTAPVLISRPGVGKSLLIGYFGEILGPGYTVITSDEHIYGRFNRHLATTLLLHSEEALFGGEKKHRGIIKSLITDEHRIFEQKGIDARQVRNYLRLILTSNEDHAAPAEVNDRRYTVMRIQADELPEKQKQALLAERRNGGAAALFHYLLNMDYDRNIPRMNLRNEALAELKTINFSPVENWWYQVLLSGSLMPDYLAWAQRPEEMPWPEVVSSRALYTSLVVYLRDHNARNIPNESIFSAQLCKFTGTRLEKAQRMFNNPQADSVPAQVRNLNSGRHNTILNLPPLAACRAAFEKHFGQKLEWPDDIADEDKPAHERY